jgi:Icc-related predicted phosphoesterase
LLIVAGDLTARDTNENWVEFENWITSQPYEEKIIIAGNHDNFLQSMDEHRMHRYWDKVKITYLCDSGTEFEGLKIWGSPWTLKFPRMNPHCMAFTCDTEEELAEKWGKIPDNVDILITHGPMHGCLDENSYGKMHGSVSLAQILYKIKPKIHCCGHIHESYQCHRTPSSSPFYPTIFINASHVNEYYKPVNKPVRVIL